MAIGKAGAANAALLAAQILALHDAALASRLSQWRQQQTDEVLSHPGSEGTGMKPVCVLGNGQLGRMLRQAGEPLGIAVFPVGLDAEPESVPFGQRVITAEIERWPETALTRELARHPGFVNRDIFPRLADRLTQKQLLDQLRLAGAQGAEVFVSFGDLAIVKRRVGGYDGRGQWRLHPGEEAALPQDCWQLHPSSRGSPSTGKCRW